MTSISISLSESLKEFIDRQAAEAGYGSAGEYVRALIDDAEKRASKDELEQKLLEGLRSPKKKMTDEDWVAMALVTRMP